METEYWLVVTEFDCTEEQNKQYSNLGRDGPLVAETYLSKPLTKEMAIVVAKKMFRYGRVWIAQLTNLEEVV